ncbi:MAG TPA: ketoacyl-ACP synthase III [Blastocatellia bacterium]|nr:ketoacyl-ACP synthase III [Blastocatellia bacterium]
MQAVIKAIEYHLPERSLTNSQLISEFPEWTTEKIEQKTGIAERRIAAVDECSSDLGVAAAQKLFSSGACQPGEIDYILLCTQTPDYFLPTTACVMQERLDIPTTAGALDFNLGCSGYVYGLGLAKGLIETGQARNVLLITAETYSKLLSPDDKSVRAIFGDAAAATLITGSERDDSQQGESIGPFVFGTDGGGAQNLIVPAGGMRKRFASDDQANDEFLYMNGPEIFTFTLRVVPKTVEKLLSQARKRLEDIDLFVFHQANKYMLDYLQKKMKIPEEKFYVAMRHCGNTVCSTIPIALKHALEEERLRPGHHAMLVGFGVGYSWGGTLIRWANQL